MTNEEWIKFLVNMGRFPEAIWFAADHGAKPHESISISYVSVPPCDWPRFTTYPIRRTPEKPKEEPMKQEYIDRLNKIHDWNPYVGAEVAERIDKAREMNAGLMHALSISASYAAGHQDWADVETIKGCIEKQNANLDFAINLWISEVEVRMPQKADCNDCEGAK